MEESFIMHRGMYREQRRNVIQPTRKNSNISKWILFWKNKVKIFTSNCFIQNDLIRSIDSLEPKHNIVINQSIAKSHAFPNSSKLFVIHFLKINWLLKTDLSLVFVSKEKDKNVYFPLDSRLFRSLTQATLYRLFDIRNKFHIRRFQCCLYLA